MLSLCLGDYIKVSSGMSLRRSVLGSIADLDSLINALRANKPFRDAILRAYNRYLKTGGFPAPIVEYHTSGKASIQTIRTYLDWLRSDWYKAGRSGKYMKEVISLILKSKLSPISWLDIARRASISSSNTARAYVETLEYLLAAKTLNLISPSGAVMLRKNKKIHFIDPLIYTVLSHYTRVKVYPEVIAESTAVSHLAQSS